MSDIRFNPQSVLDWKKLVFILPLAVLWAIPLTRAVKFIGQANQVYSENQSINASNDVSYAFALFISYALCLLMEVGLCWLLARISALVLLLLLSAPVWIVWKIIQYKPEEVIVLIPSMNPFWPLKWNVPMLIVGLGVFAFNKRKGTLGNTRTNQNPP